MKIAIIILSDPNSGADEALGRMFNALAAAYDYKQQGDEVSILFQGTGSRWVAELSKPDHPAHSLFDEVKDTVAGISRGCAEVFGATEAVKDSAFEFIDNNAVPGTSGFPSLRKLVSDGYTLLSF